MLNEYGVAGHLQFIRVWVVKSLGWNRVCMPAFAVVAPAGDGVCEKLSEQVGSPSMLVLEQ